MGSRRPSLSKSRLISAWQCLKRVHLEKNHPEFGEVSSQTESLWATGHLVGEISQQLYGTPDSVEIAFDKRLGIMLNKTRELIEGGANFPIFEATFRHEGVLVRADVLMPDADGWRIIEIKASTSVKEYHVLDCAIQDWVLRNAGINVTAVSLAHINNRFVYPGNGDYDGLLVEHDLTDEVRMLEPTVVDLVASAPHMTASSLTTAGLRKASTRFPVSVVARRGWPSTLHSATETFATCPRKPSRPKRSGEYIA
jgi:hypothetical protein